MTFAAEQGFPYWLAWGTILRGLALVEQGQGEEGTAQLHHGITAYQATGAKLQGPYSLALLAEAYGKIGQPEEGLAVLAEAHTAARKNEEHFHTPELYRLKGVLLLALSMDNSAE